MKNLFLYTLISSWCSIAAVSGATNCASDQCVDELANQLAKLEVTVPLQTSGNPVLLRDTALLGLAVEELRLKYARQLQLQAEGIVAANQVQSARAEYERAQVQLASKRNKVPDALKRLIDQRQLANEFIQTYASQMQTTTNSNLPAPSAVPGAAHMGNGDASTSVSSFTNK